MFNSDQDRVVVPRPPVDVLVPYSSFRGVFSGFDMDACCSIEDDEYSNFSESDNGISLVKCEYEGRNLLVSESPVSSVFEYRNRSEFVWINRFYSMPNEYLRDLYSRIGIGAVDIGYVDGFVLCDYFEERTFESSYNSVFGDREGSVSFCDFDLDSYMNLNAKLLLLNECYSSPLKNRFVEERGGLVTIDVFSVSVSDFHESIFSSIFGTISSFYTGYQKMYESYLWSISIVLFEQCVLRAVSFGLDIFDSFGVYPNEISDIDPSKSFVDELIRLGAVVDDSIDYALLFRIYRFLSCVISKDFCLLPSGFVWDDPHLLAGLDRGLQYSYPRSSTDDGFNCFYGAFDKDENREFSDVLSLRKRSSGIGSFEETTGMDMFLSNVDVRGDKFVIGSGGL